MSQFILDNAELIATIKKTHNATWYEVESHAHKRLHKQAPLFSLSAAAFVCRERFKEGRVSIECAMHPSL